MARAQTPTSFDELPLFASDEQIACVVVGPHNAKEWLRTRLPTIAGKPGFPPVDPFHNGRPTWLIKRFYEEYLGVAVPTGKSGAPDGREDASAWTRSKRRA